jgi:hypothetical protein
MRRRLKRQIGRIFAILRDAIYRAETAERALRGQELPTALQRRQLRDLGHRGPEPANRQAADETIAALLDARGDMR